MESRIINVDTRAVSRPAENRSGEMAESCPHCGWHEILVLQRESDEFNDCFRCRRCGHIFSPRS